MESHDLDSHFHALSPEAQAAALVYGVVDPHVRTTWQVALILRHADIQPRGRRLTSTRLQDAVRELVTRGLAYAPGRRSDGLKASPHWAPWLTMEAHRASMLDRIVAGHDHVHPRLSHYDDDARTAMALRCDTVTDRLCPASADRVHPEEWGFLAEPGVAGLLRTLPCSCRDRALSGCLMRVINAATPPEPIVEVCRDLASDPSGFASEVAFIRVLQGRLDDLGPFDLVVTTYGLLQIDAGALGAIDWHSAVLDEAQAVKNPASKRARAARELKARFRLVTTGTPVQNNLMDLYSRFGFLNPGMLGSTEHYRRHCATPVERDGDAAARARLRRLVAPFVLRRLKTEVLDDLPPRTEIVLHVEMSPAEAALYEALRRRAVDDLESLAVRGPGERDGRLEILAHLTRLRLACCNPRLVQDAGAPASSKLATFAETLDELLANRHKVLVFSQFVRHLKLIEEHLAGAGVAYQYLDGSTPARARAERIADFQAGRGDVFLISLKAGGVGLNLTAADYVIHMDPWWNPAAEDQASDRAHRISQTRPVTIYRLVAKGTIEEQIVALHHHKRDLAERLLEGADAPVRLDADELLELLRRPMD